MSFCQHLKALLRKNWILFKRSPCGSLCEILIPVILVLCLVLIRAAVSVDQEQETSYIEDASTFAPDIEIATALMQKVNGLASGSDEQILLLDGIYASFNLKNCAQKKNGGHVALSPNNTITQEIEKKFQSFPAPVNILYYNSSKEMDDYVQKDDYGKEGSSKICLGIVLSSSADGAYEYSLRFNASYSALEIETNNTSNTIEPSLASVKTPSYKSDNIALYLQGQTNNFLVLPLILPFLRMIYRLLYEKEKKIREGMKMMGMTNASFYTSWSITYIVIYTLICLINATILKITVFVCSNWFLIFFFLWFFCLVLIFQALFVSVFFTRSKFGIIAGVVFFGFLYVIKNLLSSDDDITFEVKRQASLSSHAAIGFAAETILFLETNSLGLNSSTMTEMVNNYNMQTYFAFMFINLIIFGFLSIYLDQVFPNEFGQRRHPLFFLDWLLKRSSKNSKKEPFLLQEDDDLENNNLEGVVEPVDATLKQQEQENHALLIKNLMKVYPNGKRAINNLSLNMYQNQIFVLLGHNGAGKTTTISILNGLLSPSSGTANIFGFDIRTQMETLRTMMGVCPQHDILFDDLTVEEHLYLFAAFKGTDPRLRREAVDKMIEAIDLQEKRSYLSKNLSGGQKRRLSVGIAFIGNSKLILLDEPTSGMDTSARRYIWDMLKNYKNERIVILTTHFMDEADYLGDRIGIMGEGMLKCCGSSVFLKNKFGVGYNLTIVKKTTDPNPAIEQLVFSIIKTAKCLSKVASEVAFQLPLQELKNFKELFDTLDQNSNKLNIATYGISITTLEEVFLKVAEGNDQTKRRFSKAETENQKFDDDFDLNSVKIKSKTSLFFIHFWALIVKRLHYFKRDKRGIACEIILPMIVIVLGLCLTLSTFAYPSPALEMSPKILKTPAKIPIQMEFSREGFYGEDNFPGGYFEFIGTNESNVDSNISLFDNYTFNSRDSGGENGLYGAYFLNSTEGNKCSYLALYNSTTPDSLPILMNQMNQAIIRNITKRQITIKCVNHPLGITQGMKSMSSTAIGFIASFIFAIATAFIPSSIIVFIVKEKQTGVKHQQLVSGVSLPAYWLSNYCFDLVKTLIPCIFGALMCIAFNITSLIEPDESYGAVWLIFLFYATSLIGFAYLFSFIFNEYGSAQTFTFYLSFFLSAIGGILLFILRLISSTRSTAKVIQYILRLFAPFCFGYGILNIANRNIYAIIEKYYYPKGAFDIDIAGADIAFLAIETVVYILLVFLVEKMSTIPKILQMFSRF